MLKKSAKHFTPARFFQEAFSIYPSPSLSPLTFSLGVCPSRRANTIHCNLFTISHDAAFAIKYPCDE